MPDAHLRANVGESGFMSVWTSANPWFISMRTSANPWFISARTAANSCLVSASVSSIYVRTIGGVSPYGAITRSFGKYDRYRRESRVRRVRPAIAACAPM
jgi:hypothetical protein